MAVARPAAEQEWLTVPQVAEVYGVTRQRVGQLVREGKIEAVKSGVRWRVSRRWLDAQHPRDNGFLAPDLHRAGLDEETEATLRRLVREAVREELADLAAGLAAVLHPPGDELRPRRRV